MFIPDVDECTQGSGICGNGTCVNTAGSFRCNCHSGFRLDRRGYCQGKGGGVGWSRNNYSEDLKRS